MNESEVDDLIEKALQSADAAGLLFKEGFVDFSASRAYYSMFYSLEALLLDQNKSFSKHSAVIAAFGKDFIKSGIFDGKFHKYVLEAFDIRNEGDYGAMHAVQEEIAAELIGNARELTTAVQQYILKKRKSSNAE